MIKSYITDLKREFIGYDGDMLKKDLLAGLTVTAVALPLALAFGVGSGVSAAAGLITAILSGLIIGTLSGASYQVSGPTGAMTAILLVLAQKYGVNGIWLAGAMSGLILIAAGLLKLGKIIAFIPAPVITGFTSGIALIIAIGQVDNFLGISSAQAESAAMKFIGYFQTSIAPNWSALLIGCLVIATMLLWPKKWGAVVPSSLVGLVLALGINLVWELPVAVIGEIPQALLLDSRLSIDSLRLVDLRGLVVPALSIASLGMIEGLLCGEVGSKMKGEKFNPNRELVAQGIGNFIIPFFGGVPSTAAIARTSVAIKSGAQTRLVSVFHAGGLLISMFLLAPLMSQIPLAALAGVLMVTAWRMNEWESIKSMFRHRFLSSISMFLITMVATVIFDLTQAIIIGVAFASVLFLIKISDMEISVHEVDEKRLAEKCGAMANKQLNQIRVIYFTGPLFFASVQKLNKALSQLEDGCVLILSMRGVPLVDTSGLLALADIHSQLAQRDCPLMLCGLQPRVAEMLKRSKLLDSIGEDMVFWSADQAILAAQNLLLA